MTTRTTKLWAVFSLCACLPACTLLVESAIDKKPAHEESENDPDAGRDARAGGGGDDGAVSADGGNGSDGDGSMSSNEDAGGSEDGGAPPPDGGTGTIGSKISLGYNHACGLNAAGKINCWGANAENQRTLPTDRNYLDVACGDYHSCGIDTAGTLFCVGRNRDGQRVEQQPGPFTQVTAGDSHTCTLDAAGTARCWGATDRGQSTPPSDAFSALSAGSGFTCGIRKSNGSLACWGNAADTLMTQAAGKKLVSIDAGPDYVCGVTDTGDGLCWGQSDYILAGLAQVKQIAAGAYSGCALLADDSMRCWYRGFSELIGGDHAPFAFVAVGGTGRCAIRQSGGVFCEPDDTSGLAPGPDDFP
jgi:hypothetical protein